jgi:uncharacterized protein YbjT (DUF2867 family)
MSQRTALLVGATGLVGGHCLQFLLQSDDYEKVIILVRRPLLMHHDKLEEQVVNFDKLDQYASIINASDIFCCLGTTMKVAGSQQEFRKVDFTYTVQTCAIAVKNGADQLLVVSALGANSHSKIFYNRIKGEIEEALSKLPCEAIHFFRPSLLLGDRKESRTVERAGISAMRGLSMLMAGPLKKYRPIEAKVVAQAMVHVAQETRPGVNVYESDRIQAIYKTAK